MKAQWLVLGVLCVGSTVLVSRDGHAGVYSEAAQCNKNPDGSGNCQGTFAGYRNNSDTTSFATLETVGIGQATVLRLFGATVGGVLYTCQVTSANPAVQEVWPQTTGANMIDVSWDANGQCTTLDVATSSGAGVY